jgi:sec-independent protein translocase protein TatC
VSDITQEDDTPDNDTPANEPRDEGEVEESRAPLLSHLIELRRRLLYSVAAFAVVFVGCILVAESIYAFLVEPLSALMQDRENPRLIFTGLAEVLFTQLKVAFFAALMISFPILAGQMWMFIAPGLYRKEKLAFLPFLIATPVLFTLGAAMAYYVVFPFAWDFFLSFEAPATQDGGMGIEFEGKVDEYLSIVMRLIFAFGVSFMLPVALVLLGKVGIISAAWLQARRRYAIVFVFILGAILTPADPFSQIAVAVPVLILFEISIIIIKMIEKTRSSSSK